MSGKEILIIYFCDLLRDARCTLAITAIVYLFVGSFLISCLIDRNGFKWRYALFLLPVPILFLIAFFMPSSEVIDLLQDYWSAELAK